MNWPFHKEEACIRVEVSYSSDYTKNKCPFSKHLNFKETRLYRPAQHGWYNASDSSSPFVFRFWNSYAWSEGIDIRTAYLPKVWLARKASLLSVPHSNCVYWREVRPYFNISGYEFLWEEEAVNGARF